MFLSNRPINRAFTSGKSNPEKVNKLKASTLQTADLNKNPSFTKTQTHRLIPTRILRPVKHLYSIIILS